MKEPQIQLGLLPGFDAPLLPAAPIRIEPPAPPPPPPRKVSAEREMLAAQGTLAISMDPPDVAGWREELGQERPRIVAGVCTAIERWRRLEDGTLGPCPWVGCPNHTLIDRGPVVEIGGGRRAELLLHRVGDDDAAGRRPALPVVPTEGDVEAFEVEAFRKLDLLATGSCRLDGASEEGDDGEVPVWVIAARLGISTEQVRLDTLRAAAKLGLVMVDGKPEPGDARVVERILAAADGARVVLTDAELAERRRRVAAFLAADPAHLERALAAPPAPPLVRIRRIERDAPAPVELSADAIFTF